MKVQDLDKEQMMHLKYDLILYYLNVYHDHDDVDAFLNLSPEQVETLRQSATGWTLVSDEFVYEVFGGMDFNLGYFADDVQKSVCPRRQKRHSPKEMLQIQLSPTMQKSMEEAEALKRREKNHNPNPEEKNTPPDSDD